ncbi:hypothetical protein [Streptosporangium saharense]|uniref:hypothetical protein n=1 Tax=Streptosporangium saharense TaxID=1706840 RepID=UPI00331B294A
MSLPDDGDDLRAVFYCKDPNSQGVDMCDTFYRTDRASWIVQGKRRGERVATQLVGLADDETFVEVSEPTVAAFVRHYVKEHHGVDLG